LGELLHSVPVLVIPGFFGTDAYGRTHCLGRGGSDLTAVFLAVSLRYSRVSREALALSVALSVPVSCAVRSSITAPRRCLADQNTRPPTKLHHAARPLSVLTQPQSL